MRLLYILFFSILAFATTAQTTQVEFGKNRVQFHDDYEEWSQYESQNFITFWYGEGRYIGQFVVQSAEFDHDEIQDILEHRMNDKIEIIVYTDLTDLKQSNIGSEETFINTGGQTKIVGNKMFVYFDGNHQNLRREVRKGIATVYMNAMLFGSNLQEIVQNAVTMNLPNWFKEGLISYVGEEWSVEIDNKLRDLLLSGEYETFDDLAEDYPALAGHSLWHYIGQNYGKSNLSNLLYLTRINRSVESGFLYVLGTGYGKMTASWKIYFLDRYKKETAQMGMPAGKLLEFKNKRNLPIYHFKLSPDGKKAVYVSNEIGRYKVYLQDLETGDREVVLSGNFRNNFQATDYNYPLLAWNPNNQELGIIHEQRDVIKLLKYDINTKDRAEEPMGTQYQRIYSMDYANTQNFVLSAAVRGQSDLFLYYSQTRQTQRITSDFWDDLDARVVNIGDKKGVLFASNRQDSLLVKNEKLDTILPTATFDIFYYDLENKDSELVRVTNTPSASERQPAAVDTTWYSYLTDVSGVYNRASGYLEDYIHHYDKIVRLEDETELIMHPDSALTTLLDSTALAMVDTVEIVPVIKQRGVNHVVTNYRGNIVEQATAPRVNKYAEIVIKDDKPELYVGNLEPETLVAPTLTLYQIQRLVTNEEIKVPDTAPTKQEPKSKQKEEEEKESSFFFDTPFTQEDVKTEPDTGKVDIDNYFFQSEFNDDEVPPVVVVEDDGDNISLERPDSYYDTSLKTAEDMSHRVMRFKSSRITPYRLKFRTDYVTTQMDNEPLFGGLNSFVGTPQGFGYLPPGILMKGNFKDLFEDYEIEGGLRLPTSFNGTEFFLVFDDKKKRLDKRYAVYRRALRFNADDVVSQRQIQPRDENTLFLTQYQVRYPLNIFMSLRGTATLRFDQKIPLATELSRLETPIIRQQRAGIKGEFVFDNTLQQQMNILNGSRWKIFTEVYKGMAIDLNGSPSFSLKEGVLGVIGFDARHYQRILKYSVLAGRIAGQTSFGSEKILYMLGGTDNWLLPRFNDEIGIQSDQNYAFQTVQSNIRGFDLNIRNGNSFALANVEMRVPLFRYFSKNIRSNFLKNFQLVGFFDAGTAWTGLNPFDEDSPLNTAIVESESNPVTLKVNYFRDPIVMGYGAGVRMTMFGYFLRIDYAKGIETRQIQDRKIYLSLGLDF